MVWFKGVEQNRLRMTSASSGWVGGDQKPLSQKGKIRGERKGYKGKEGYGSSMCFKRTKKEETLKQTRKTSFCVKHLGKVGGGPMRSKNKKYLGGGPGGWDRRTYLGDL